MLISKVDTTVFGSTKIATDGLGKTPGGGNNKVAMVACTMDLSGSTLPQVSLDSGVLSGTFHVVTTDGAGPIKAMIDTTGSGTFSSGIHVTVMTQVPGKGGVIKADGTVPKVRRFLERMNLIEKRADNVNKDFVSRTYRVINLLSFN